VLIFFFFFQFENFFGYFILLFLLFYLTINNKTQKTIGGQIPTTTSQSSAPVLSEQQLEDANRVNGLIHSFQRNGHRLASLDPLGLKKSPLIEVNKQKTLQRKKKERKKELNIHFCFFFSFLFFSNKELDYKYWGFSDADLDREMFVDPRKHSHYFPNSKKPFETLRTILQKMNEFYAVSSAAQFTHLLVKQQRKRKKERKKERERE